MPRMPFTESLKKEYENLFNTCAIRTDRMGEIERTVAALLRDKSRYEGVGGDLGIPWFFVAVIHNMEASRSFTRHLTTGIRSRPEP